MLTSIDVAIRTEHDCAKAAAAIRGAAEKSGAAIAAMPTVEEHSRASADAEAWAFANYGQKIKPLMQRVLGHECANDPGYKSALAPLQ